MFQFCSSFERSELSNQISMCEKPSPDTGSAFLCSKPGISRWDQGLQSSWVTWHLAGAATVQGIPTREKDQHLPIACACHKTMWFKQGKKSATLSGGKVKLLLLHTWGTSNASNEQRVLLVFSSLPSASLSSFLNILQFNKVYFLQLTAKAATLYSNPGSP